MKRFFLSLIALIAACAVSAQVTTQNYVRTRTMLNDAGTSYVDDIAYYDGLGRPFQNVQKATEDNAVKSRLATLQEYDLAGRETSSWLPISVSVDFAEATPFKTMATGSTGYSDSRPYSHPLYEASPLNRVLQQYGPGIAWHTAQRPTKIEHLANTFAVPLNCKRYGVTASGTLDGENSYYANGQLFVEKVTDEDLNVTYTFTDKQGNVLLVRAMKGSEAHDTYYIYDDKGNLRFVLQPMYQTTADLDKYAFQYRYDGRGNCIWKKQPGAGYVEMVYDSADCLTFSQDGNQRTLTSNNWTYYKYDNLNRLTEQGVCTNKVTTSGSTTVHIKNYYDDYSFRGITGFTDSLFADGTDGYGKGFLTGSEIAVLGSSAKLYTANYYDIRGRVVKTVQNNLLSGYDVTTTTYTFTDKPQTVTHTHTASGKTTRTEVYTYSYDYADRISKVEHTLEGTKVTLYECTYDQFGRLQSKQYHGSASNKLTYAYNLRNWLTGISGTKFTQNLYL